MKAFAALLDRLVLTPARNGKLKLLSDYFRDTPDPDRGYGLAAIAGTLDIRSVKPAMLRELVLERMDEALFRYSYDYVGDLAETISLVWDEEREDRTADDPGLGAVIAEMNRVGMVVDMSHSAERSTLEAIELSTRPIAITHANPHWWHKALRNKSDTVLKALTRSGGMLGLSLYPHHLKDGSNCTLQSFCEMVAETASRYGVENIGIGSDLCQDQPDSVVTWMRNGRWSKVTDYGEGTASAAGFPTQPHWFTNNSDLPNLREGLRRAGFSSEDVAAVMGGNWLRFYSQSFEPKP